MTKHPLPPATNITCTYHHIDRHGNKTVPKVIPLNPKGYKFTLPEPKVNPTPSTWAMLHQYKPSSHTLDNLRWFTLFGMNITVQGCNCNQEWAAYCKSHPPDFSTLDKWFQWTVAAHNSVNMKLSKPILTVDQAKEIWQKKP